MMVPSPSAQEHYFQMIEVCNVHTGSTAHDVFHQIKAIMDKNQSQHIIKLLI